MCIKLAITICIHAWAFNFRCLTDYYRRWWISFIWIIVPPGELVIIKCLVQSKLEFSHQPLYSCTVWCKNDDFYFKDHVTSPFNPMNMTTCWNSSANFSCAINESMTISWLINGQDVVAHGITSPPTICLLQEHSQI